MKRKKKEKISLEIAEKLKGNTAKGSVGEGGMEPGFLPRPTRTTASSCSNWKEKGGDVPLRKLQHQEKYWFDSWNCLIGVNRQWKEIAGCNIKTGKKKTK